jgi:hypothetical protein
MILTGISFLLALSMLGLAISNIYMAGVNMTRMDLLKGSFKFNDRHGTHPNPYNLGFFANIASVFEGNKWLFWWPTETVTYNDGT